MSTTAQASKSKSPPKSASRARRSPAKPSREHMIAEAAYFIAEKRGFNGGDHIQDWLAAEAQIDMQSPARKRRTAAK